MYTSTQSVESHNPLLSKLPLASSERRRILNDIFGLNLTEHNLLSQDNGYEAFFDWYEEQWESAPADLSAIHQEVLDVIALLKSADQTRADILDNLRQSASPKTDSALNSLVTLAARVWLMLSIGRFQQSLSPSQGIIWNDDGKLSEVLSASFSPHHKLSDQIKLPMAFTAESLEKIAGIRIAWTSDLSEHLKLREDDTKIVLFHQVSVLELHRKSQRCENLNQMSLSRQL